MKSVLTLASLTILAIGAAQAGPILTLGSASGVISGTPGETVGWGFDLTADSADWVTITSAFILFDSNPALGMFTDFISPQGGPDGGALPPIASDWIQTFDPVNFTGFGSYAIDPQASIGDSDTGTFLVEYETFTANPATCDGACFDSSGQFFEDFTVNVASPEPSAGLPILIALALMRFRAVSPRFRAARCRSGHL